MDNVEQRAHIAELTELRRLVPSVCQREALDAAIAALASQVHVPEDGHAREVRAIGTAVERVAEVLPDFWSVRIELERGSGIVYLENPDGQETMIDSADTFSSQINEAIDIATAAAPAQEVSETSGNEITDEKGRPMTYWGGKAKP